MTNGGRTSVLSQTGDAYSGSEENGTSVPDGFLYSKRSPGWQSSALQIASNVESRIAFALPFFKTEILAIVIPTLSVSSVTLIFRFANMTSMLMMIAMLLNR